MTYHELLHSVTFDEITPFLEKKNGGAVSLALYKTHYDMLRLLTPRREEDDNKTATITNAKLDYDWEEPHLEAFPMEGDLWEVPNPPNPPEKISSKISPKSKFPNGLPLNPPPAPPY